MKFSSFEELLNQSGEMGFVETFDTPIVHVRGLPSVFPKELIMFENGSIGQVLSLDKDSVEVLTLSNKPIELGSRATRTCKPFELEVGKEFLGHTVNPFGECFDETTRFELAAPEYRDIEKTASGISSREKVTKPLETGVTVVDLMVPLGKGQRELVIGDRKTGKTEFVLQTLLTQSKKGAICVYACVGKNMSEIRRIESYIQENGLTPTTVVVASSAMDSLGSIYITPYSAMTIAEYFRDLGNEVVIVLDDLTTHAKYYREIALIGRRFPGRNSYPGDIFYTHSRLLERAGNFKTKMGAFPITCLAIGETIAADMSGYIITNLMSVTDGHIYFDEEIFTQGRRPAVNYFLSVTRVGRQTQNKLRWDINRELTTILALLEKSQVFAHFGAELSEGIRSTLAIGNRILDFFNQPMGMVIPLDLQIFVFAAVWTGMLKNVDNQLVMDQLVHDTLSRYQEQPVFREFVENMVTSSDDFNSLLGKMRTSSAQVLGFLNVSHGTKQEGN